MGKLLLKNCGKIHTMQENFTDTIGTLEDYSIFIDGEVVSKIDKYENLIDLIDDETKIILLDA